jgi:CheY-like chemotaxis protein
VVAETGRGDEAVELVREHRPDVAILDIKMPGLDGLSAAREIAGSVGRRYSSSPPSLSETSSSVPVTPERWHTW